MGIDGAAGPGGGSALTWLVTAGLVLAVLGAAAVQVLPAHERAVVLRLGRVARLRGPGLVLLLPGLERVSRVSLLDARVEAVEEAVQHEVARSRLADLAGGSEERSERLVRATTGAAARWGVEVEDVAVVDVDLPLGPELLHWAATQAATGALGGPHR